MKRVKKFIENFIFSEYKCKKGEYNFSLSDDSYEVLRINASSFFHNYFDENFWRGVEEDELENMDDEEKKEYEENNSYIIPRTLFQIKEYKDFKLGDSLQRIVTGKSLYVCYVSYEVDNKMPLDYCNKFYIAETNEGLKIIYKKTYGVKNREWRHSHDLEVLQVIEEGALVSQEKYQAPEESTSLADYNRE